jgi:hypothetical protein
MLTDADVCRRQRTEERRRTRLWTSTVRANPRQSAHVERTCVAAILGALWGGVTLWGGGGGARDQSERKSGSMCELVSMSTHVALCTVTHHTSCASVYSFLFGFDQNAQTHTHTLHTRARAHTHTHTHTHTPRGRQHATCRDYETSLEAILHTTRRL